LNRVSSQFSKSAQPFSLHRSRTLLTSATTQALWLTFKLASTVVFFLVLLGTPLAWWLARSRAWIRIPIASLVSLPFVLPPSVLGFYFLLAMGPNGPVGQFTQHFGLGSFAFSFRGLVLASVIQSLPFMVQPLQNSFESLGKRPLEIAATLGYSPFQSFLKVALPLCNKGIVTGIVMTFAHVVGEFGIVLMIGGSIPKETKVISIHIYDLVESLAFEEAHKLAAVLLIFSFLVMLTLQILHSKVDFLHKDKSEQK
jgi:molybdate transport system permease protein